MPLTRSYKQRALRQEDPEVPGMLQARESSAGPGWKEYLNWDLPELAYREDSSGEISAPDPDWYNSASSAPLTHYADASSSVRDATNDLSNSNFNQSAGAEFCGLQRWYSTATQDLSSGSSEANTRPQLADSANSSYEPTLLGEMEPTPCQSTATLPWSSRGVTSSDEASSRMRSSVEKAESIKELGESLSPPSSEETGKASATAKLDANKKRKIAHSVIEKNYRSRIKRGMAELRHCVPSTEKGKTSSRDSSKTETQHANNEQPSHSSGKVATLSDAVQYVKSLELRNEALHGKLEILERRNETLQRIALSKVCTTHPLKDEAMEELDQQEVLQLAERSAIPNRGKRSKTSPSGRHSP